MVSPTELRILLLLEELGHSGVPLLHGVGSAELSLRLIHVLHGLGLLVGVRGGHAAVVSHAPCQVTLVHVLGADPRLVARVGVWAAELGVINVLEVVLLGASHGAVLRADIAPHGLFMLEELLLGGVLAGDPIVVRVEGILSIQELLWPALALDLLVPFFDFKVGVFPFLVDHLGPQLTPANVASVTSNGVLIIKELFSFCLTTRIV